MLCFLDGYLHAKIQNNWSITSRYILLHRYGVCTGKLRIVMFFIFCYFQQKLMPKFHWSSNSILAPFFGPFCSFEGNKNFSRKFFCGTLQFLNFYCCAKFQKKLMKRFWEKLVTDVCLDKPKFTGAPFPGIHSYFKSWNMGTLSMLSYSVVICLFILYINDFSMLSTLLILMLICLLLLSLL